MCNTTFPTLLAQSHDYSHCLMVLQKLYLLERTTLGTLQGTCVYSLNILDNRILPEYVACASTLCCRPGGHNPQTAWWRVNSAQLEMQCNRLWRHYARWWRCVVPAQQCKTKLDVQSVAQERFVVCVAFGSCIAGLAAWSLASLKYLAKLGWRWQEGCSQVAGQ